MKYVVYMFSAIGFVCFILLILFYFLFFSASRESDVVEKNRCIEDGGVERLDSFYDEEGDAMYELLARTTGFSDKVTFVYLVKGDRYATDAICIEKEKIVFTDSIYYGSENKPDLQWPISLIVKNEKVQIKYTEDPKDRVPLVNVEVSWQ